MRSELLPGGENDPMSEPDSTDVPTPQHEFVADPGLDAPSVAAMTGDEAKEYLKLLREVLRPELPSLTWLRRAASSTSEARPSAIQRSHALGPLRKLLVEGQPPISP
jgi:hypothetical protein